MLRFFATIRITIAITTVCLGALFVANLLGVMPDERPAKMSARAQLCESIATGISMSVSKSPLHKTEEELEMLVRRNPEIISAGLRRADNKMLVDVGNHQAAWSAAAGAHEDGCFVVPIVGPNGHWGALEVRYRSLYSGMAKYLSPAFLKLLLWLVPLLFLLVFVLMIRTLKYLDPSRVVPARVRQTLDSFAEGVLLMDTQERIVLANEAFASCVNRNSEELIGKHASDLPWVRHDNDGEAQLPWKTVGLDLKAARGISLALTGEDDRQSVFSVNSVPVLDDQGEYRGVMAAFADVTALEEKQAKLLEAMEALRASGDEIRRQNEELQFLATRDPLTSCLNRRSFFERVEVEWERATRHNLSLSCVMLDIDYFKSINDQYGHSAGDQVLTVIGTKLLEQARQYDLVCRYGGEEFCILMPQVAVDDAERVAERLRRMLQELQFEGFSITGSFGVSSVESGALDVQQLLDEADKSLYIAKRNGRNQVARWDKCRNEAEVMEPTSLPRREVTSHENSQVPYRAVTALLSTLAYRDPDTAAHSVRVADLAVLVGRRHMSPRRAYQLEIAALLHDIGKIGVPDSILLKPGPLTEDEWAVMVMHDRFSVEIVNASFGCMPITEIIRHHHDHFCGANGSLVGDEIPLGARIVTIADSYDAMVTDRPYRMARSTEEAFAELRRCAGTQFDPVLVEEFIEVVQARDASRASPDLMISQDVALNIGQQIEQIIEALSQEDLVSFGMLSGRLGATAEQSNLKKIAGIAAHVSEMSRDEGELTNVVEATHDLLEMWSSLYSSLIHSIRDQVNPTSKESTPELAAHSELVTSA